MKKLLTGLLLAALTTLAIAKDIDMTQSRGTEQSVILSLTPPPANMDADQDVVLKAVFDVELDAKHVQKNNVKLKKITESQETMIDGEVVYDGNENAVTFRSSTLLTDGYYEVEFKSLKATKANKEQQIKEIKYRFYVPKVINGYKLPLEPDSAVNYATLLGIDSNDNGVRDDVERYIIIRFQGFENSPIDRSVALQYAKATQIVIQDPEMAWENKTYEVMHKALDCTFYYYEIYWDKKNYNTFKEEAEYSLQHKIFDAELKDKIFNTRERLEAYLKYNDSLSGHMYPSRHHTKENCDFDVDTLFEKE